MAKTYVGKNRLESLDWLLNTWLKEGPTVCFLQGFPGVGKTDLARDFRALAEKQGTWQQAVINEIADRSTPSVVESLMELSVVLSNQGLPEMEKVLFEESSPNPAFALEKALQRPVIIILDEAQRFFQRDANSPLPEMNGILAFLRNRPSLKGRLLLLSDRLVEEARWSEWIPKRTLTKLEPDEAVEALNIKLKEAGIDVDIPYERRKEAVRDLDFNPRAIGTLVGALQCETLDQIIESNPGLWAVRDREVSREFLMALERDLLERTMSHLEPIYQQKVRWLSVHRRSFKRQALERLCKGKNEAVHVKTVLVGRFLANFHTGDFSLNPIVREISLARLRDQRTEFRQAHSKAADYHLRHFKAKQVAVEHSKLGESFAELRYHLTQAGRQKEIKDIGHRFTDHLMRHINFVTPVPTDPEELDERIGVLTVLLEDGGAKGFEYHLARCLQARGRSEDLKEAVNHADRAVGSASPEDSWYLLAKLRFAAEGTEPAVVEIYRGLHALAEPPSLYRLGAEILSFAGRTGEALTLLKEGIKVVPPDKSLVSLYETAAEIMAKAGKSEEAVALLRDGIKVIPADKNLFSLYQIAAEIMAKAGKSEEAVALLKGGIKVVPPDKSLVSLYETAAEILAKVGRSEEAVALLRDGIQVVPTDKGLSRLFLMLCDVYCRSEKVVYALLELPDHIARLTGRLKQSDLISAYLLLALAADRADILIGAAQSRSKLGTDRFARHLAEILLEELHGNWSAAASIAADSRKELPQATALWEREAFALLSTGILDRATEAVTHLNASSQPTRWLTSFIELRGGNVAAAKKAVTGMLGREPNPNEITEEFLLRIWDEREPVAYALRICLRFPLLAPTVTGRATAVRRMQFGPPALLADTGGGPAAQIMKSDDSRPDIYISYAWGEDSTLEGKRREEIVDRLCDTVRATGREIGRDKERMRGGDSIERFAYEISKAKRIIAVISEKSLHSDFCMAQELFRAFRRCDYQRAEFQEKVISLVMDDARPLLRDELSVLDLAKYWKDKCEKLREGLIAIDPDRRSHDQWVFVGLIEDMVPRLPEMLAALRDIVMKRGFDAIVADHFREVLDRLPSGQ